MILVFDLGTTYFKLALVDQRGQLVALCRVQPSVRGKSPGIVELDTATFADVLADAVAQLEAQAPGSLAGVKAVTFATQTNSFVLLDADNRPLTPIILWPDERALQLADELHARCSLPEFLATTGVPAAPVVHAGQASLDTAGRSAHVEKGAENLSNQRLFDVVDDRSIRDRGWRRRTDFAFGYPSLPLVADHLARFEIPPDFLPRVVRAGTDLGPLGDGTRGERRQ